MPEEDFELRSIAWSKSFPFVRLFRTFKLAIDMRQLTLALACVVICYFAGRVLDRVWRAADAGVLQTPEGPVQTEIAAYATRDTRQFDNWKLQTERSHQRADVRAVMACTAVSGADEAELQLATQPAQSLLKTEDHERDVAEVRTLIDDRLASLLDAIDANEDATSSDKQQQRQDLLREADYLRLVLAGCEDSSLFSPAEQAVAVEAFADPRAPDEQTRIRSVGGHPGGVHGALGFLRRGVGCRTGHARQRRLGRQRPAVADHATALVRGYLRHHSAGGVLVFRGGDLPERRHPRGARRER